VTGGSVANLQLIGTGKSEVGLSMVDAVLTALQGVDKFKLFLQSNDFQSRIAV